MSEYNLDCNFLRYPNAKLDNLYYFVSEGYREEMLASIVYTGCDESQQFLIERFRIQSWQCCSELNPNYIDPISVTLWRETYTSGRWRIASVESHLCRWNTFVQSYEIYNSTSCWSGEVDDSVLEYLDRTYFFQTRNRINSLSSRWICPDEDDETPPCPPGQFRDGNGVCQVTPEVPSGLQLVAVGRGEGRDCDGYTYVFPQPDEDISLYTTVIRHPITRQPITTTLDDVDVEFYPTPEQVAEINQLRNSAPYFRRELKLTPWSQVDDFGEITTGVTPSIVCFGGSLIGGYGEGGDCFGDDSWGLFSAWLHTTYNGGYVSPRADDGVLPTISVGVSATGGRFDPNQQTILPYQGSICYDYSYYYNTMWWEFGGYDPISGAYFPIGAIKAPVIIPEIPNVPEIGENCEHRLCWFLEVKLNLGNLPVELITDNIPIPINIKKETLNNVVEWVVDVVLTPLSPSFEVQIFCVDASETPSYLRYLYKRLTSFGSELIETFLDAKLSLAGPKGIILAALLEISIEARDVRIGCGDYPSPQLPPDGGYEFVY